ncbi:uracil-DNA glycosylase [Nocardioidaceae bacterium]|nr:uracil-DNA glycosylase [Nocardioidaceae bacterium]
MQRARSAAGVRRLAATPDLDELDARVSVCRACPRLVAWREDVAVAKRASYADEPYWGRPVPGFGDTRARVLVVGLAPAAHGANRTGRNFTGDRSGDWLYAAMHRTGFANQPDARHSGDGLQLRDLRVVAAVRCAPPENKPTTQERDACAPWLQREVDLLAATTRVVVCLGGFGWDAAIGVLRGGGWSVPRPKPRFGHGAEAVLTRGGETLHLLGSFHPSQQNTFTGRLTEPMLDAVLLRARELADL